MAFVFDPIIFSDYIVNCARRKQEVLIIENNTYDVEKYELIYNNTALSGYINSYGKIYKCKYQKNEI